MLTIFESFYNFKTAIIEEVMLTIFENFNNFKRIII